LTRSPRLEAGVRIFAAGVGAGARREEGGLTLGEVAGGDVEDEFVPFGQGRHNGGWRR